jgi:hypothetical protein
MARASGPSGENISGREDKEKRLKNQGRILSDADERPFLPELQNHQSCRESYRAQGFMLVLRKSGICFVAAQHYSHEEQFCCA